MTANRPVGGTRCSSPTLDTPLELRSGVVLANRIAKAAMEEQLATPSGHPDERLARLYRTWDGSGAGLLLTGHVMIDRTAVAEPADVILDSRSDLEPFTAWSRAATNASLWMQINHPGRVVQRDTGSRALAPSAVPVELGGLSRLFPTPIPMDADDIHEVIERFAITAQLAERAGFAGVEIHAAHGYLLAQFLSPLVNKRSDQWGGSLKNRARLLLEVIGAVRARVSPRFGVAVKLNSADFQRGGFDVDDAHRVIEWVSDLVDFVEISGGSVESLATAGHPADERTLEREAYFLNLSAELAEAATVPLMLTGGIRRGSVAQSVLDRGFSLAGAATALAWHPRAPRAWVVGDDAPVAPVRTIARGKALRATAIQASTAGRIRHLGKPGLLPTPSPLAAVAIDQYLRRRAIRARNSSRSPSP